tara:strand:+ start:485 stop:658 length:174 start_codon:yes stop_codon:yes gene_type:complete
MNDRTMFFVAGGLVGMVAPQIMPIIRGYGERPPFVPTILIGLGFGAAMWLIYPLILG